MKKSEVAATKKNLLPVEWRGLLLETDARIWRRFMT